MRPERVLKAAGPGGMAVVLVPRPRQVERLALLAADYGSNDLTLPSGRRTPPGVAHFLEHALFETDRGNASDLFSARGADSNAFTDNTMTAYHVSSPDRGRENLELLLDFVCRPEFPPAKVEKERGIILQELGMYRDSPGSRLGENLLRSLYVRHPARLDIGGTPASVRAIRRDDLLACHAAYYAPANLCLVVVADTSLEEVLGAARDKVPGSRRSRPPHRLPAEPTQPARRKLSARMDVAQPQALLGFKDPSPAEKGLPLFRRRMAVGMALAMLLDRSAPLYQALYDEGLMDEDFSAGYSGDRGFAYAAMGGKAPNPEGLRRRLLEGLDRAKREGFPPGALERAKRKSLGAYLCLFDRPQSLAAALASAHFLDLPILDYPRHLKAFRIEDAERALSEVLDADRHAFSVVWPRRA